MTHHYKKIRKKNIGEYLLSLENSSKFGPQIVARKTFPERQGAFTDLPDDLSLTMVNGLRKLGYKKLYSHQREAIDLIRLHNKNVIISTPTASGKSLIYNFCVFEKILQDFKTHALYIYPLKALAQDQLRVINNMAQKLSSLFSHSGVPVASIYDGDTSPYARTKIRKNTPPILITNPDMVHLSFLPYHESWCHFYRQLRFIVIDEVHTYRGVFGSHMSWVIKRLIRIASHYGATPQVIMLSATIGNPKRFSQTLLSQPLEVIKNSGAPQTTKHMVLLNPWDSAAHTASLMVEAAIKRELRTIVYTQSRKMTELITLWTRPRLGDNRDKLSSYRAGFLPEERREIEHQLTSGQLLAVITTSALELGIDIGDLDLCLLMGYPGSIMASYQRGGRVGRGGRESLVVLIAQEDALDQHFMRNPDDFFRREVESAVINPENPTIMDQHLNCAAAELQLLASEELMQSKSVINAVERLSQCAILLQSSTGDEWFSSQKYPQRYINLRGSGSQLTIINMLSGEILGEIDSARALKECHPGALYLHRAKSWLVEKLDLNGKEVIARDVKVPYYTRAISTKQTQILSVIEEKIVYGCRVRLGTLRVTEQVTSYHKRNKHTSKLITSIQLDLPQQVLETEGVWIDIDQKIQADMENERLHFMGSIHALEHGMIAMFPLLILCDRNDIGGISCVRHEQTGVASIFIYDGQTGGVGLCREAFIQFEKLLEHTVKTVSSCSCSTGCPSCVHSPKCGSGNRPIDKEGCLALMKKIMCQSQDEFDFNHVKKINIPHAKIIKETGEVDCLDILPARYGVFDLETKFSAAEVGGWHRADKMGISVAVVYDSSLDGFTTYLENEIDQLINHLFQLDLIVGFNNKRFDNRVLSGYTGKKFTNVPTLDILEEVHNQLGYRLSLNGIAEQTLGVKKTADGLKALQWYKEGEIAKIVHYCKKDVEITRNLLLHGLETGFFLFQNKSKKIVRLPLSLDRTIKRVLAEKGSK